MKRALSKCPHRRAFALVITMIFVVVFTALSVSMFSLSMTSVQASENHLNSNHAMNAAISGLEYARYLAVAAGNVDVVLDYQAYKAGNFQTQADLIWEALRDHNQLSSGTDGGGKAYLETGDISYSDQEAAFNVRFTREDTHTIKVLCTGVHGQIQRTVAMTFRIEKQEDEILNYGLVGRGRMWITGDTTIHGSIYSSWDNPAVSPFNMTDDSRVEGTINTVLARNAMESRGYQLETLDGDARPMFEFGQTVYDAAGNPVSGSYGLSDESGWMVSTDGAVVFDADGNRIPVDYSTRITAGSDEIQGYHEGINYNVAKTNIDKYLNIDEYDTSYYYDLTSSNVIEPDTTTVTETVRTGKWPNYTYTTVETEVPVTTTEYFPHGANGYDHYKSGSVTLNRNIISNRTITNAYLSSNKNALFENCTFEGVLYIDCSQSTSGSYNNIRFNNCTFNGVIVTNTPDKLNWQRNALYFTGSANFQNTSDIQEATILAPHFNVDLGDANNGEVESDQNVITGAVVGGIVDIRGNAEIFGTVISMCDTSQWTNGYVTNIGATLDDGGSETTSIEDIGTINITPDTKQSLFPGLKEYPCTILMRADTETYEEII